MIRELRTFLVVTREGTFASAGNMIGLTQAAVSAQMQRLEAELGFKIFDRTGRNSKLTSKGRQLVTQANELILLYDNLGSRFNRNHELKPVVIGSIASVHKTILSEALALFFRNNPLRRMKVIPGLSIELINMVDTDELDLAVVIRPPFELQNGLKWTSLIREPFRLVVSSNIRDNDYRSILEKEPFLRYDRTSFGGRLVENYLREKNIIVNEICELDELEAILHLVRKRVGVALLPQTLNWPSLPPSVRAIDLGIDTFYREIGILHKPVENMDESVDTMISLILEAVNNLRSTI